MAVTLACFVHDVSLEDIRVGLTTFTPSTAQTPGRMNFVPVRDFTVLMDFAHNPAGVIGLKKFIEQLTYKKRIGVLSGVGDRRDEDLREMGKITGEMFDHLIIRRGDYLRGRTQEEVFDLLKAGVKESGKDVKVEIIEESREAVYRAFDLAQKDDLVVVLADTVHKDIALVNEYREENIHQTYA